MTPEQKAKELIEKYIPYADKKATLVSNDDPFFVGHGIRYRTKDVRENAKQCAIITVDEILGLSYFSYFNHEPTEDDELYKNFWQQVKQSIQSL